jgi:fumarate hydratase class II
VGIGDTFTVDIYVNPDTAIAGVQFSLAFDASILQADSVTEGNLLNQGGASTYFMSGAIDNVAGTISDAAGAITTPGASVSSPGAFATVSFTATAAGTSNLNLSSVVVGRPDGSAVTTTETGGSVTVYPNWDVNMDGSVNVLDMTTVGQHWGETGAAHWIREDVNTDGVIDVLDMILIGQHWTG